MDIEELQSKDASYDKNLSEWTMFKAAYKGSKALVDWGALEQHRRESEDEHNTRVKNAYGLNKTAEVVDLHNSYVFSRSNTNIYGKLSDDELFSNFLENSNLQGSDLDDSSADALKWAAVFGHVGIFIDKPEIKDGATNDDAIKGNIYPFITQYSPLNILKLSIKDNEISYLKLLDDDGLYRIWTKDSWENWRIEDGNVIDAGSGINKLKSIPFFLVKAGKTDSRLIGKSDISEISRIDISILRLLSGCEEIFNVASFPMLMKPEIRSSGKNEDVSAGSGSIMLFDKSFPNSKPEWLKTAIAEPIKTIDDRIDRMVNQIYKLANLSGNNSSLQRQSGESLRREFMNLNALLSKKSEIVVLMQEQVIYWWCMWQDKMQLLDKVSINRPNDFDVSSLSEELDSYVVSNTIVKSVEFNKLLQKQTARKTLPELTEDQLTIIDEEIDKNKPENLDEIDSGLKEIE